MRRNMFSSSNLAIVSFLAVGGYFLWNEHQVHLVAALPWLLIGGCLVMHLFMHRSHGGHRGREGGVDAEKVDDAPKDSSRRAP